MPTQISSVCFRHVRLPGLRTAMMAGLLLCAVILPVAAQSSKSKDLYAAEGLENWEYGLDLSSFPAGKYNIVVEGTDTAGNVVQGSPMNIYVDPASDLPIVSIVNPTPYMRVGGDLHIVGTCKDDDAVARVEVSLDNGEFLPAEGADFWSLYLKTGEIPDGRRTISVRGVDVNGLVGNVVKVFFNLDRAKPTANITSPAKGSLVAGPIRLDGEVYDANGVSSLEISTNGGKAFSKVDLRALGSEAVLYGKTRLPAHASFSLPVDTRKLEDGPRVFLLKSEDGVGSTSTSAHLLFVDNTKRRRRARRSGSQEPFL
jgi:hypothetical protein